MYRLTRLSLAHPRAVLLVLAAITIALGAGLPRLRTEFGYRVLIGDDHPAMRTLDEFVDDFGGVLPAFIVWECGDGSPCSTALDESSLEMAHTISEELRKLNVVKSVTGVSNAPLLVPTPGGFAVRHFVEDGRVVPDATALAVRARDDPLWVGTLISADARVGAIVIQPIDNASTTDLRVVAVLEQMVLEWKSKGFELALVGDAVANLIAGRELAGSSGRLVPITVAVIALVVFFLTRSWQFTAVALGTMGVAYLWTFGLLAWIDWPQDGILEVLAPLILAVGVCDAIHLLSRYSSESARGQEAEVGSSASEAMLRATRDVAPACVVTTLTTAGAFLSFSTSRLETFVRFGMIAAFGVLACLILTFTLLPVLTTSLRRSERAAAQVSGSWNVALLAAIRLGDHRATPILLVSFALLVGSAVAWGAWLRVDSNFFDILGRRSQVMRWVRFVEERFRPIYNLEVEVAIGPNSAIEDPATLSAVAGFSDFLEGVDGLEQATSVVDLVARVNRALHEDDASWERVPDSSAGNAEILELLSLEDSSVMGSWLTLDRRRLRVSVTGAERSYSSRDEILRKARQYVDENLPEDWGVRFTGEMAIMVDWVKDVQGTQLRSFPTAFALVFVMILFFLRSVPLAAAAMVPTLLPVVVCLGAMGWMGMSLDIGRAMIAAVVIGIGVDDAIHLLSRYKVHRAEGDGPSQAIRKAVLHVGRAVVTTSVALALGFLTLMASAWQTISSFGLLVAVAILGALLATVFVLPALVYALDERSEVQSGDLVLARGSGGGR